MAKFGVLAAVVGAGYPALALVGVVASVIALFYCLWLVKVMFFELPEAGAKPVVEDFGLLLVLGFAVAGVVVLGIWPWILTGMVY
ncbi:MAG: hypothetical protein EBQ80_03390 [Proteobacteria bacterium]|nr:hypothetical protein [Pseudomonadota bacterium]